MSLTKRQEDDMKIAYEQKARKTKDPVELIQARAMTHGVNGIRNLARAFKCYDSNGDRQLCLEEFEKALLHMGLKLSPEDVQHAFDKVDADGNGTLDYNEFLAVMRPPMAPHRREMILKAFRKLDRDNSGEITTADLRGVYSARRHPKYVSGDWTEEKVFQNFLKTFDSPDGDGIVTQQEFIDYYTGVSVSIDNDAFFDLMMRQAWAL